MTLKRFTSFTILLIFLISLYVGPTFAMYSSNEALMSIVEARSAIEDAYEAVFDAEEMGANVSELLEVLNFGAYELSQAHIAYRIGDFDNVVYHANLTLDLVQDIAIQAEELQDNASLEKKQMLYLASSSAIIVIIVICLVGFVSWRLFKKRYNQQISSMKPEVTTNEA